MQDCVLEPASVEDGYEERERQWREGAIEGGEVGFGDAGVEAPEGAEPDEENKPAGVEEREDFQAVVPLESGEDGQAEDEDDVEDAPAGEDEAVVEEEGEVLGPAFDHGPGGPVHARGKCVGGVAEP